MIHDQLTAALRAALNGEGPNGILVLGPSGSGKTALVRACIAQLGCRVEYGNALTVRNRAYFTDMDPQESGGSILDFLVPVRRKEQQHESAAAAAPAARSGAAADTILVVDDLDMLANDLNHGLDGLLKLLTPPQKRSATNQSRRRICVCIAAGRHKSDKHLLDLYRRCTEIRVRPPPVWDPHRGAAAVPPAAVERTLYPLVHDLLTRPMDAAKIAAKAGLSEPDRVTVGLLFHENVHDYCSAHHASDATLAAIAHDHATADAIGTLAHQAQTWHLWELCYLLRTFRGNLRLFPSRRSGEQQQQQQQNTTSSLTPSFTKLLTRCSTEVGTRAFLTDMCFRLGCTWHELFPRLAQLDAEYTTLVTRPTPPVLLACLRQAGGGARRRPATASIASSIRSSGAAAAAPPAPPKMTAIARTEWVHRRLTAQLVVSRHARYTPELALSEVRRMYRCLRAESGSVAASSKKRTSATHRCEASRKKRLRTDDADELEQEEQEEQEEEQEEQEEQQQEENDDTDDCGDE